MPPVHGMEPVGCSSNVRLYKYSEGMRFGRHVDGSHADSGGSLSQYTVLIYLNDASHSSLRGGATAFYAGQYSDADVEKSQVLCFEPRRGVPDIFIALDDVRQFWTQRLDLPTDDGPSQPDFTRASHRGLSIC